MVDKYKGIIELESNGVKRGFKFGLRSMTLFCESQGICFKDSKEHLEKASKDGNMGVIVSFYHAGAVAYARLAKIPEPSLDEVFAWVDEIGMGKLDAEIEKVHDIPNEPAPETAGQP